LSNIFGTWKTIYIRGETKGIKK